MFSNNFDSKHFETVKVFYNNNERSKMALNFSRLYVNSFTNFRKVPHREIKRYVRGKLIDLKKRQKIYYENMSTEEYNELFRRSNFIEWNYSAEVFAFGKRLHEEFHPELLVQAFTHSSYLVKEKIRQKELGVENPHIDLKVNDDLAAEGEKIIFNYSGRYVSHFFPRFPLEGIESVRNYLISDELLGYVSKNLGTTFLILSQDYPVETPTYSKTLKAITGALKKCQGLERTELFVRDIIVTQLAGRDINDFLTISNPMEVLREILKKDNKKPPEPRIIFQCGMKTILSNYHVGIYSNKQLIGHCSGETVETATEMAALDALKRLFHTTSSCTPISYDLKDVPKTISNLKLSEWNSAAFDKQTYLSTH